MEVKRDILWRVGLSYFAVAAVCITVIGKAFYIQQVEGKYWRTLNDSLHEKIDSIDAERGTIYSADGEMLSTSVPQFDIYIDFGADGLRENEGARFYKYVDSLSDSLAVLFKGMTANEYSRVLREGYKRQDHYFPLLKKVNFEDYKHLKQFPLVKLGRNKSGFIPIERSVRLNPFNMLAARTIGTDRENAQNVGLEKTYDSLLKGHKGRRLVRFVAGVAIPVDEDYQVAPENGKDIITTIDTHIQDIAETALMKMLVSNEAQHGCAIVLETKTGKVKAIANLGLGQDGQYREDVNHALRPTEPGSTFKLVTLLSLLEDKKVSLGTMVNMENGRWVINGQTVIDAEEHGVGESVVPTKKAFEESSNVAMAKLAYGAYETSPSQFINHIKFLGFDSTTGVDVAGESQTTVHKPGKGSWHANMIPWMAFGYNISVTPMHTAMLYNAIANNGKMMRPYIMSQVVQDGEVVKEMQPVVLREKVCSDATLQQLKECLIGVCADSGATAFRLFKGNAYKVAGKTGTALVADGKFKYADQVYQSSFAGYFPAENPQYTCVVVIVNKPHAVRHVGALVAGPVFKEIADKLYSMYVKQPAPMQYAGLTNSRDSVSYTYTGAQYEVKKILTDLNLPYSDASGTSEWASISKQSGKPYVAGQRLNNTTMPQLNGMSLKDAVYVCENMGLKVNVKGRGRVTAQSVSAGQLINKGLQVQITLN